jgi:VWFA-related protein
MRSPDQLRLAHRWTLPVLLPAMALIAGLAWQPAAGQQPAKAVASTASPGQPAPPQPRPAQAVQPAGPLFGETIEVRVVNVEAVVTDRQGNRVPDLEAEDFRLKVDGKPVKIDYFNEVRAGQAMAREPGAAETVPGLSDLEPGRPVGTSYLVFVDDYFSIGPRRDEVLRSIEKDLARLGPDDRMALVAFDGRRLRVLSSWSSSSGELAGAIEREIASPAHGFDRLTELRSFTSTDQDLSHVERTGARDPITGQTDTHKADSVVSQVVTSGLLTPEETGFVETLSAQLEREVAAATSTLRSFASPPGRRVMLLLVGGWPFSPGDYALENFTTRRRGLIVPQGDVILRPLIATANRVGYTLYTVDVPGVETAAADASAASPSPLGARLGLREREHEATLTYLAKETGGRALLNSLRIASLEHVEADTRSYYWLGFTPSWQGNDKRHTIQLEVLRPGLAVRTRESFLDRSRKAEISMMVESAMLFGNSPGAPEMPVRLGKPVRKGPGEMEVPVTLAIPTLAFTSVLLNGKYASELELHVAALDEHGGRSAIPVLPLKLASNEEPRPGRFVRYQTTLKLRRTSQRLSFAIFDTLSNKITLAEVDVKPD